MPQIWAALVLSRKLALLTRANALFSLSSTATGVAAGLGVLHLAFMRSTHIGGVTYPEAVVLYGWFLVFEGAVGFAFVPSLARLPNLIRAGHFDAYLLIPNGITIHLGLGTANAWRIVDVTVGLTIILIAAPQWTAGTILCTCVGAALSFILLYSVWICLVAVTIAWVRLDNIAQLLVIPLAISRFPLGVYPAWLRILLLSVLPIGLVTSLPASAVIQDFSLPPESYLIPLLLLLLSRALLRRTLARYEGV